MRGRVADLSDVKGPDHRLWALQVGARPRHVQGLQAPRLIQVAQTLDLITSGSGSLSALTPESLSTPLPPLHLECPCLPLTLGESSGKPACCRVRNTFAVLRIYCGSLHPVVQDLL